MDNHQAHPTPATPATTVEPPSSGGAAPVALRKPADAARALKPRMKKIYNTYAAAHAEAEADEVCAFAALVGNGRARTCVAKLTAQPRGTKKRGAADDDGSVGTPRKRLRGAHEPPAPAPSIALPHGRPSTRSMAARSSDNAAEAARALDPGTKRLSAIFSAAQAEDEASEAEDKAILAKDDRARACIERMKKRLPTASSDASTTTATVTATTDTAQPLGKKKRAAPDDEGTPRKRPRDEHQ